MNMQRTSKIAALCLTVTAAGHVYAVEEVGWRDAQGNPIPEADHIRSSKGFGGSVLITPDADWKEKWKRPEPPQFTTTDHVKLGQSVMALVFFTNPAMDDKGNIRILCDYQLLRPDNSLSENVKDAPCAAGQLDGSPRNIRLVDQLVGFTGEASDLEGVWTIKVRLRDTIRGASVDLIARFDYHREGT
jgi:hypothetical protein